MNKNNKKVYKSDYEIVEEILKLYDNGYSKREIAENMNQAGYMNAFIRNFEMIEFIREKDSKKRLFICNNMNEMEDDAKEYPKDEFIAQEMLEMLDNGNNWLDIFNKMAKKGQIAAFRRNYKIVYSIYETDKLENSNK